jgi:hypothetical protein
VYDYISGRLWGWNEIIDIFVFSRDFLDYCAAVFYEGILFGWHAVRSVAGRVGWRGRHKEKDSGSKIQNFTLHYKYSTSTQSADDTQKICTLDLYGGRSSLMRTEGWAILLLLLQRRILSWARRIFKQKWIVQSNGRWSKGSKTTLHLKFLIDAVNVELCGFAYPFFLTFFFSPKIRLGQSRNGTENMEPLLRNKTHNTSIRKQAFAVHSFVFVLDGLAWVHSDGSVGRGVCLWRVVVWSIFAPPLSMGLGCGYGQSPVL